MRLLLLFSVLVIASCHTAKLDFKPSEDSLPDAKVAMYYEQEIVIGEKIEANPAFLNKDNTSVTVSPDNSGLQVLPKNKSQRDGSPVYNALVVKGTPLTTGEVHITISGYTYGTMYTRSRKFNKTYTLRIK